MARCPEAAGQVDGAGAERAAGECGRCEACTVRCGGCQRVQVWPSGSWASAGSGLKFVVPTVTVADGKGFPGPGFRDSLVPAWLCVGTLPLENTQRGRWVSSGPTKPGDMTGPHWVGLSLCLVAQAGGSWEPSLFHGTSPHMESCNGPVRGWGPAWGHEAWDWQVPDSSWGQGSHPGELGVWGRRSPGRMGVGPPGG